MTRCIPFLLCSLLFFLTEITTAQQIVSSSDEEEEPEEPIRVGSHYSILPVIRYSSDLGFVGGGYVQRLNYGNNVRPFKNNLQADISFSTKGNIVSEISFEQLTTFGLPIRSRLTFIGGRLKETNYFGIGNETEDRKSTRLNSSHVAISYAVFCLKKKKKKNSTTLPEFSKKHYEANELTVIE